MNIFHVHMTRSEVWVLWNSIFVKKSLVLSSLVVWTCFWWQMIGNFTSFPKNIGLRGLFWTEMSKKYSQRQKNGKKCRFWVTIFLVKAGSKSNFSGLGWMGMSNITQGSQIMYLFNKNVNMTYLRHFIHIFFLNLIKFSKWQFFRVFLSFSPKFDKYGSTDTKGW